MAELGALYMSLNLPSHIRIKAVTFGTPRVGNQAFASYFDARVCGHFMFVSFTSPLPSTTSR